MSGRRLLAFVTLATAAYTACSDDNLPSGPDGTGQEGQCTVTLTAGDSVGNQIRAHLRSRTTVCLVAGDFFLEDGPDHVGVRIADVDGFTIRGVGPQTRIILAEGVLRGFQFEGRIRDLEISNLTICRASAPGLSDNIRAISNAPELGPMDIVGVTLTALDIHDVNVGMGIGGNDVLPAYEYADVLIAGNSIHDIPGDAPANGYGIAAQYTSNLLILDNELRDVDRHSIYISDQSEGAVIANNLIVTHGENNTRFQAAVVVARSSGVTVVSNRFVNSRSHALSVEFDERHVPPRPTNRIRVIGNRFIGTGESAYDIWVNPDETTEVTLWGNETHNIYCETLGASEACYTDGRIESPSLWSETQSIRPALRYLWDRRLYVMRSNTLHSLEPVYGAHPNAWEYRSAPDDWTGFQDMSVMDDRVFVMRAGQLYEVDPDTWAYRVSPVWSDFKAMTAYQSLGRIFLVSADTLYRLDPAHWSRIGNADVDWSGANTLLQGMPAAWWRGSSLFVQNDATTYEVNPQNLQALPVP